VLALVGEGAHAVGPLLACRRGGGTYADLSRAPAGLRGKLLNVRDATAGQISENVEIQHIKQVGVNPPPIPIPPLAPPVGGRRAWRMRPWPWGQRLHGLPRAFGPFRRRGTFKPTPLPLPRPALAPTPLQILGLQHGKQYEDVKALRYGSLMIMTDQVREAGVRGWGWGEHLPRARRPRVPRASLGCLPHAPPLKLPRALLAAPAHGLPPSRHSPHPASHPPPPHPRPLPQDHDGSHIKGLIMNFLHTFYPSLLKIPGFLVEFITPIIKVGGGGGCAELSDRQLSR
jgi:hypothetical protein